MTLLSVTTAQGIAGLLALIVFACATGFGLLSLFGFPESRRHRLLLSPMAATMAWALTGDMLVRAGFTMAQVAVPIWIGSIVPALVGVWLLIRGRTASQDRGTTALLLGGAVITIVSMVPALTRGLFSYIGYIHFDTFMYAVLSAGYWDHGIATPGESLSFFFQQVSESPLHLGKFRNHTMVLLAFFSPLVEAGEPAFVRGLFVAWLVFITGLCGAYYFQIKDRRDPPGTILTLLYLVFIMVLGWASVPAIFGSWDNALFIGLLPMLAGFSYERGQWRLTVALGVTLGYAFLTYPELCPILAMLVAPFFLLRLANGEQPVLTVARDYLIAGVIAAIVIAPASAPMLDYVTFQLRQASTAKPGGQFASGLFDQWWVLSSWWGLGTEHMEPIKARHVIGSLFLTALFTAGLAVTLRRRRPPQLWALAPMVPFVGYLWAVEHYPYAVYKILTVSWWLIAQVTLDGLVACWRFASARDSAAIDARRRYLNLAGRFAIVTLVIATCALGVRGRWLFYFPGLADVIPSTHELADLRDRARGLPPGDVVLAGEVASNPLRALWVWYGLRDTPLHVYIAQRPNYPTFDGFIWTKEAMPDTLLFGLGDRTDTRAALVSTPRFTLVDTRNIALLAGIENPNGTEEWGTWLGTAPITISIRAQQPQAVQLEFEAEPGPSRPESPERTLILMDNGKELARTRVAARQQVSLPVSIGHGVTQLVLRCEEPSTVASMPNGDARPMMVAIRGLSVRTVEVRSMVYPGP